jgi:hypothetical protein
MLLNHFLVEIFFRQLVVFATRMCSNAWFKGLRVPLTLCFFVVY